MTAEGVSSLLITEAAADAKAAPRLVGILTDRDLRTRLVAPGQPLDTPVHRLMTTSLVTVQHEHRVSEAWQQMQRHNVHHLPVLNQDQPIGVITLRDLFRHESHHSVYLVGSILRARTVDELAALTGDVRATFVHMAQAESHARLVGGAMSAIGRSFKQRLLELAEAELGPPPVPYCFLALGSMARQEQLIVTDQDNAMVLSDDFDPGAPRRLLQGAGRARQRRAGPLRLPVLHRWRDGDQRRLAPAAARVGAHLRALDQQPDSRRTCSTAASSSTSTACAGRPAGSTACASRSPARPRPARASSAAWRATRCCAHRRWVSSRAS